MASTMEIVGENHRIVRRMSGAIQAERWNDSDGKWEYIETLCPPYTEPAAERAAIEAFKRGLKL